METRHELVGPKVSCAQLYANRKDVVWIICVGQFFLTHPSEVRRLSRRDDDDDDLPWHSRRNDAALAYCLPDCGHLEIVAA